MPDGQTNSLSWDLVIAQSWRISIGVGAIIFTMAILNFVARYIKKHIGEDKYNDMVYGNFPFFGGLPSAMVAAFGLVVFFEATSSENIEISLWGLSLKGPAAPLTMWVIVFLSITLAI